MLPFAVRETGSGEIVGSTRYYEIDAALPRLAIGYTWYAKRWQKTHLNTACKRLLLEHAFETLGCAAVAFHTDERNENSQRAIERLGAQREGVLRATSAAPTAACATRSASASSPTSGRTWRTGWRCV
jgi:RimJ/RimL family protein N-acetyltransferase